MGKLHELLAAAGTAKGQAEKCRADLLVTFDKKRHLFGEKRVTFTSFEENKPPVTEEQSDLQSTIRKEVRWLADIWVRSIDAAYQIAESNMGARADVTLDDGTVLFEKLPATALLELEKRASEIHAFITAIPTLDPAKGFRPDADRGEGIYRAREVQKTRTRKVAKPIVLAPATKEHPAQTQLISVDEPVGTISELEWSGLITPAEKADMLDRAEELRRVLKKARSKANEAEAVAGTVGKRLFDYVFKV
jgi:hypothetical protein